MRCRYNVAIKCLDYVYAEAFCLLAALLLTGVALRCLMRGSDVGVELARIVQANASELPDAATLTLACWPKQDILAHIRVGSRVRTEVVDNSQYSDGLNDDTGLAVLNTEIISANVPDLLVSDRLPIAQYGTRGAVMQPISALRGSDRRFT